MKTADALRKQGWCKITVDSAAMEQIMSADALYDHIAERAGLPPQELSEMTFRSRNISVAKDVEETLYRNCRQFCQDYHTDLGYRAEDIEDMILHLETIAPRVDRSLLPGEVLIILDK